MLLSFRLQVCVLMVAEWTHTERKPWFVFESLCNSSGGNSELLCQHLDLKEVGASYLPRLEICTKYNIDNAWGWVILMNHINSGTYLCDLEKLFSSSELNASINKTWVMMRSIQHWHDHKMKGQHVVSWKHFLATNLHSVNAITAMKI